MYFIQEGIVDVVAGDQRIITSLSDGSYFGGEQRLRPAPSHHFYRPQP